MEGHGLSRHDGARLAARRVTPPGWWTAGPDAAAQREPRTTHADLSCMPCPSRTPCAFALLLSLSLGGACTDPTSPSDASSSSASEASGSGESSSSSETSSESSASSSASGDGSESSSTTDTSSGTDSSASDEADGTSTGGTGDAPQDCWDITDASCTAVGDCSPPDGIPAWGNGCETWELCCLPADACDLESQFQCCRGEGVFAAVCVDAEWSCVHLGDDAYPC